MNADAMKVLVVSAQFPYPATSGFARRVLGLTRQLAARHDVTLLSLVHPGQGANVERLRREVEVEVVERSPSPIAVKRRRQLQSLASLLPFHARTLRSPDMQAAIDRLQRARRFDVVQLESSLLSGYDLPTGAVLVLDEHNIEYEVFRRVQDVERSIPRRLFNTMEYHRTRRFERDWWRKAGACVVTSDREQVIVGRHAPATPVAVVPNAADLTYFCPSGRPIAPATMVFNGLLEYRPNLDAASYLVEEIWPLVGRRHPGARLTIVGRGADSDLRRLTRENVAVTGEVPDVRPYLEAAAVVGVPIRMGGGTRLKVIEALAMGKAVVSTTLGCEGVRVADQEHLLVADDPASFASSIVDLFADRALAERLGNAGRALMEREYSWDIAGARLQDLYQRIMPDRVN